MSVRPPVSSGGLQERRSFPALVVAMSSRGAEGRPGTDEEENEQTVMQTWQKQLQLWIKYSVCVENDLAVCADFIFLYHVNGFIGLNRDFVPEQGPVRGSAGAR